MIDPNVTVEIEETGIELLGSECMQLLDMFENHPGWQVLMKLKGVEKNAEIDILTQMGVSEINTEQHRAVYHKIMADIEFPDRVKRSVADAG
jgi:hypothetical protein